MVKEKAKKLTKQIIIIIIDQVMKVRLHMILKCLTLDLSEVKPQTVFQSSLHLNFLEMPTFIFTNLKQMEGQKNTYELINGMKRQYQKTL